MKVEMVRRMSSLWFGGDSSFFLARIACENGKKFQAFGSTEKEAIENAKAKAFEIGGGEK